MIAPLHFHDLSFPPPSDANDDGVLAYGNDLRPERLIAAYEHGAFPWPIGPLTGPGISRRAEIPILWFHPDPRFVLPLSSRHVGRSTRRAIRSERFSITFDTAFPRVMAACADVPRPGQNGSWITPELFRAFVEFHALGYAHSVEAWLDGRLVGGVYGVSLGRAFFGESMFAIEDNASKVAFSVLLAHLVSWGFDFVDCQVHTTHLERFGAEEWPRARFVQELKTARQHPTRRGPWEIELSAADVLAAL